MFGRDSKILDNGNAADVQLMAYEAGLKAGMSQQLSTLTLQGKIIREIK
jgi:hypothetical protein